MKQFEHGTASCYNHMRCRCDECKAAMARGWRERKESKKGVALAAALERAYLETEPEFFRR